MGSIRSERLDKQSSDCTLAFELLEEEERPAIEADVVPLPRGEREGREHVTSDSCINSEPSRGPMQG